MSNERKVWFITGSNSGFGYSLTEAVLAKGDPDKAALAMIEVVNSANPPLRLALGEDALNGVRQKMESFEKELKEWENVTLNTAFKEDRTSAVG